MQGKQQVLKIIEIIAQLSGKFTYWILKQWQKNTAWCWKNLVLFLFNDHKENTVKAYMSFEQKISIPFILIHKRLACYILLHKYIFLWYTSLSFAF